MAMMAAKASSLVLCSSFLLVVVVMMMMMSSNAHAAGSCGLRLNQNQNQRLAAVLRRSQNLRETTKAAVSGDLVTQTCVNATRDFCRVHVKAEACESALRSDKRSASAKDARDLTLLAFDLVRLAAVEADAKVGEAMKAGGVAKGLQFCRVDYDAITRLVPACRDEVERYVPSSDEKYWSSCPSRLYNAALACANDFPMELSDALLVELDGVVQRANLANALLGHMLGHDDDLEPEM